MASSKAFDFDMILFQIELKQLNAECLFITFAHSGPRSFMPTIISLLLSNAESEIDAYD